MLRGNRNIVETLLNGRNCSECFENTAGQLTTVENTKILQTVLLQLVAILICNCNLLARHGFLAISLEKLKRVLALSHNA